MTGQKARQDLVACNQCGKSSDVRQYKTTVDASRDRSMVDIACREHTGRGSCRGCGRDIPLDAPVTAILGNKVRVTVCAWCWTDNIAA